MSNQDWEKFGKDVLKTVQEAIETRNYDKLSQTVGDAVNQVVDEVTKSVKDMTNTAGQKNQAAQRYAQPNYGQAAPQNAGQQNQTHWLQRRSSLVKKPTKAWGILLSVFGFGISAFCILLAIVLVLAAVVTGEIVAGNMAAGLGVLAFEIPVLAALAASAAVGIFGTSITGRIDRFNKYVKRIGAAELCNVTELAAKVSKSSKFVVKDLEKMIKKGWFIQGHLDQNKTCLMISDEVYEQYKLLEQRKALLEKEEAQRIEEQNRKEQQNREKMQSQDAYRKTLSPEVQKVIEQGDAYIQKIRECNDAIPGEEISAKIYRMEMIVDKIFDRVEQNPQSVKDIRKLMEYYLPTTIKLLDAYAEMDAQPVGGENIQTAKKEIEATLDTLNVAYEKLLDSLFQEKAWDVSTDISVLNTMLAQEGLKEDGLKNKNN